MLSKKSGYINSINAQTVGKISRDLGAGRIKKEDKIDNSVGIVLAKKVSEYVKENDVLAYIHANNEQLVINAVKDLLNNYEITENIVNKIETIIDVIK